ncbi:MAG: hypothetical protein JXA68_00530 [Ignavibacteriales bacterium]|nr:hypothetical protein [Ignavibacteriales bacterium]
MPQSIPSKAAITSILKYCGEIGIGTTSNSSLDQFSNVANKSGSKGLISSTIIAEIIVHIKIERPWDEACFTILSFTPY